MSKFILALAISLSTSAFAQDGGTLGVDTQEGPWSAETTDNAGQGTVDFGGETKPNAVHVAVCVGTDTDKRSIKLVDRLCLNDPAVREIRGVIASLMVERQGLINQINDTNQLLYNEKLRTSGFSPTVLVVAVVLSAAVTGTAVGIGTWAVTRKSP